MLCKLVIQQDELSKVCKSTMLNQLWSKLYSGHPLEQKYQYEYCITNKIALFKILCKLKYRSRPIIGEMYLNYQYN